MHSKVCLSPLTVQLRHKTVTNSISTFNILWKHILAVRGCLPYRPQPISYRLKLPALNRFSRSIHNCCFAVSLSWVIWVFGLDLIWFELIWIDLVWIWSFLAVIHLPFSSRKWSAIEVHSRRLLGGDYICWSREQESVQQFTIQPCNPLKTHQEEKAWYTPLFILHR